MYVLAPLFASKTIAFFLQLDSYYQLETRVTLVRTLLPDSGRGALRRSSLLRPLESLQIYAHHDINTRTHWHRYLLHGLAGFP